jgi:hypothetical protein
MTMSRSRTRAGWAVAVGVAFVLAGCGSSDGAQSSDDVLLDRGDVSPLEPTSVSTADPRENSGTQHWPCADNDGILLEQGWEMELRDLRSTSDSWAVYSAVLDNPDASAPETLPEIAQRVDECRTEGSKLEEVDLGEDAYGYRSVTPDGTVDTVRAYAVADDHRLVQVTVLGLNDEDAPDAIDRLLEKAVDKAG